MTVLDHQDLLPAMPTQPSWVMTEGPVTPALALGTSSSEQSLKSLLGYDMLMEGQEQPSASRAHCFSFALTRHPRQGPCGQ